MLPLKYLFGPYFTKTGGRFDQYVAQKVVEIFSFWKS
jgi:hypothetical protein